MIDIIEKKKIELKKLKKQLNIRPSMKPPKTVKYYKLKAEINAYEQAVNYVSTGLEYVKKYLDPWMFHEDFPTVFKTQFLPQLSQTNSLSWEEWLINYIFNEIMEEGP